MRSGSARGAGAVGVPDATADPDRPRRVLHSLLYIYSVSTERKPPKNNRIARRTAADELPQTDEGVGC